jgi:Cd2+/Zn2+-exporting ATPase
VPKFKSTGLIVYVAINNQYEGYIILEDEIREESFETVKQLKELGIDVAMLSGDTEDIAWDVANQLGIQKVYANMNPIDKVRRVRKLKKNYNHKKIVFVGDGMNDAPVLSCADVGIAMGGLGSDAAIDVADIVLMTDDLTKLIDAIKISRRTVKIVYQNIIFSLAVKGIVLLGAVVLPQYTKMWEGVFADVGVSLIAVINSMRVSDLSITKIFKPQFDKIFKPKK